MNTKCLIAAALSACALTGVAQAQTQHSLVIGIDGMGFGTFGFSNVSTPNLDSLINGTWQPGYSGAYAGNAFAGGGSIFGSGTVQPTLSGPGWSTILTGVWADKHSVTNNSFITPDYENHETYLETLEENIAGIHTASVVGWTPIDTHIIPSITDGDSALDFRSAPGSDSNVASTAATHLGLLDTSTPSAMFLHFLEVDSAGHSFGSGGVDYGNKITETDGLVGQLLGAVSSRTNFANEDWQVVVIADHGQKDGGGHGGQTALERTVPLIVASSSAGQGDIFGIDQSVSQVDVVPTVLDHFGVAAPGNLEGASRALPGPGLSTPTGALVDFGVSSQETPEGVAQSDGNFWNNISSTGVTAGTPEALRDAETGLANGWTIAVTDSFDNTSTSNNGGETVFVESATTDFIHVTLGGNDEATVQIAGLDGSGATTYDFTFFGSSNRPASQSLNAAYTIDGTTVELEAVDNTSNTVSILGVTPNALGEIDITLSIGAGTDEFAVLSALQITAVPEPSSLALLGLSGLLIARRRRSRG